jgi:hypothetical protein
VEPRRTQTFNRLIKNQRSAFEHQNTFLASKVSGKGTQNLNSQAVGFTKKAPFQAPPNQI